MIKLSSLAALMGMALLTMTAQPQDAAAQSSGGRYYTYELWIQYPDGSQTVSRHRMPSDLARQVQRLAAKMSERHFLRGLGGPGPDLEAFSRQMEALSRQTDADHATISRWLDQILEPEPGVPLPLGLRLEPVWGPSPGSPYHSVHRGGDGESGGEDGGDGGGGGED